MNTFSSNVEVAQYEKTYSRHFLEPSNVNENVELILTQFQKFEKTYPGAFYRVNNDFSLHLGYDFKLKSLYEHLFNNAGLNFLQASVSRNGRLCDDGYHVSRRQQKTV